MSQTLVVKVRVEELTKYGYKADGQFVGLSKLLSDADRARLVPGAEFEAEYYVSDGGKQYLNKIIKMADDLGNAAHPSNKDKTRAELMNEKYGVNKIVTSVDTARAKRFTPKFTKDKAVDNSMSKDEWAAKDRRISRQGCIQIAVQVESKWETAVALAEKMLEFVNS